MAVHTITCYRVTCDRCGVSAQDRGEHYCWTDRLAAIDEADEQGWLVSVQSTEDEHYCEDCTTWSDDEEHQVPKEPIKEEE